MDKYVEIVKSFHNLSIKRKRNIHKLLNEYNLSSLEGKLIYLLHHNEDQKIKISTIVHDYNIDCGQLSRRIKNLEKRNLVFVKIDDDDKRQKYLVLNREAKLLKNFKKQFWKEFTAEFRVLDDQELSNLENYLTRMVNSG